MSITEDATITSKGQVTIPKEIREKLDLQEGDQLEFVITDDGELTIRRKRDPMDRLRDVRTELAPLSVNIDDLRHQAKAEWSSVDEHSE